MHHVFVLLILKQCQAPWGAKKNFIEKTFKINVTNRFFAIKTNLVEKSVKNQTSLMCTVSGLFSHIKSSSHSNTQQNANAYI